MAISPEAPYEVAVGMGDNSIKLWTFSGLGKSIKKRKRHDMYEATSFWKGLQGQIEHIAWHPKRAGILAYSTQYGRVGFYDVHSNRNTVFKAYHKQDSSPSIAWGPLVGATGTTDVLVSCGSESVFVHEVAQCNQQPVRLESLLQENNSAWIQSINAKSNVKRTCMAMDPSGSYLAFGYTDGVVDVYSTETLKLVFVTNAHRHAIQSLAWQSSTLLASGCKNGIIAVHTLSLQGTETSSEIPVCDASVSRLFSAHKKAITDLAWSTHKETPLLASTSLDMLAYVWTLTSAKPIACFREHRGRIFSVCWGILEPDELFTGGDDKFIFRWKYTHYPYTLECAHGRDLLHLTEEAGKTSYSLLQRYCLTLAASFYGGDPEKVVQYVKGKLPETLVSGQVNDYTRWVSPDNDLNHKLLMLFGSKNEVRQLLSEEGKKIYSRGDVHQNSTFDMQLAMDAIRGHYASFDQYVAGSSDNSMTDWIALALSPMAGKETWMTMMETQAEKLAKAEHHFLAATCYIACSKIYEAVHVYRKGGKFREAIALAKTRLPTDDTLLGSLFSDWANALQKTDQEDLGALWYIIAIEIQAALTFFFFFLFSSFFSFLQSRRSGSIVNAIQLLARRGTDKCLFWSSCLACLTKDPTAEERILKWVSTVSAKTTQTATTAKLKSETVPVAIESTSLEHTITESSTDISPDLVHQ
ncbi:WD40-repeat-containing domain protein [Spinellus fusiger]|nr:WD40-repeat-containing domain protein [Spinellus fusiger]